MKTVLSRIKTLVKSNMDPGDPLSYVKDVEIIHPDIILTSITIASLPKVCVYPEDSSEKWMATKRKEDANIVSVYALMMHHTREVSIIGDDARQGGGGKGITNFVEDLKGILRGQRLSVGGVPYLSFPIDIESTDYADPVSFQNAHLIVAKIILRCPRMITITELSGDIA